MSPAVRKWRPLRLSMLSASTVPSGTDQDGRQSLEMGAESGKTVMIERDM